jgi:predicted amidohydrolase
MHIYVALWSRDTEHKLNVDQDTRLSDLKEAVKAAHAVYEEQAKNTAYTFGDKIKAIFLAPEYLFTNKREEAQELSRAIDVTKAEGILTELCSFSKNYDGMLIIPGTVIYRHPVEKDAQALTGTKDIQAKLALSKAAQEDKTGRLSRLAPPGESFDIGSKVKTLEGGNGVTHLVKNRLHAFLKGKVVANYGKIADRYEVADKGGTDLFVPGRQAGVQDIEGLKFGFEVCYDHDLGVLKALGGVNSVDFHVILSAWVDGEQKNMLAREGGFVLHACSDKDRSNVYFKPNQKWKDQYKPKFAAPKFVSPKDAQKRHEDWILPIGESPACNDVLHSYVIKYETA